MTAAFWLALLGGVALRITLVFTSGFLVDSDVSVVYLMAKHVSEGEVPLIFWGQTYGGTVLQLVAGAAMLLFGVHIEVLAVVSTLFFAGAAVLVRHLAARAFSAGVGALAGILFFFSGYYTLKISISEPGFYGPSLVLGLGAVAVALARPLASRPTLQWALTGLLAGLAFWQSPMGAALALPAVGVLLARDRSAGLGALLRRAVGGVAAAVVGALLWLISVGTTSTALSPNGTGSGARPSLRGFVTLFTTTVPAALSISSLTGGIIVAALVLLLLAVLLVVGVARRNPALLALVGGTALVTVVLVVGSGVLVSSSDTRYAVFLAPTLATGIAWAVCRLPGRGGRIAAISAAVLAMILTLGQIRALNPALSTDTSGRYIVGDIADLGDYLEANGDTASYGDYWVSYAVTAETGEAVTMAPLTTPRRYEPYEQAAASSPKTVIVVLEGNENDRMLQAGVEGLPPSMRTVVSDYAVYTFDSRIDAYDYAWMLY